MIFKAISSLVLVVFLMLFNNICSAKEDSDQTIISAIDSSLHKLSREYRFQKKATEPFSIPKGIKASFPLSCYDGKPSCVVTREIFNSLKGYITIFHEFIHCSQMNTCEQKLKNTLLVAQIAAKS